MENVLIKLYDTEIDLEEFLLVDEENVKEVLDLLEAYRKLDPECYNIDGFFEVLDEHEIEYTIPVVQKVYF